uniref:WxxW domain-containing protein n=1 Tax=Neogobius melanostomus TaxID=47308 RepID=A0A8C6SQ84_9GOBI
SLQIQVLTTGGQPVSSTGDFIDTSDTEKGFICKNSDQKKGRCSDYKVRFLCPIDFCAPPPGCWTDWFDRDNPSGKGDFEILVKLQNENPGKICNNSLQIQVLTTGWLPVSSTGDIIDTSDTEKGFICINSDQKKGRCSDYQVRFQCPDNFCPPPQDTGCWTDWFDRDNSSGKGDFEILIKLRKENPGEICNNPLQIQVLTIGGHPVSSTGDIIDTSDTKIGFICKNSDQKKGRCSDYKVRFLCPPEFCAPTTQLPKSITTIAPWHTDCWTQWFDRDNPSGPGDYETLSALHAEYPGKICANPLQIQVLTTAWHPVSSTGDIIDTSDTVTGFICKNSLQTNGRCSNYQVRFQCPPEFCAPTTITTTTTPCSPITEPRLKPCIITRPSLSTIPLNTSWTQWFDRDNPSGTGDWETLAALHQQYPGKICAHPLQIQVLTTGGLPVSSTGNVIHKSDPLTGFVCKNSDQTKGKCSDFRVRFLCPSEFFAPNPDCWTQWFDRDDPAGSGDWETLRNLLEEYPGMICPNPVEIQAQTTAGHCVSTTGDVIHKSDTVTGFVCKNSDQQNNMCSDYRVRFRCPPKFCTRAPVCWTGWFNRDDPIGSGDWETLNELKRENPGKICPKPLQIEAQTTAGEPASSTGDVIYKYDTLRGFICKNCEQENKKCRDYKVRFLCPLDFCTPSRCYTEWFDRDDPSGSGDWETLFALQAEHPGRVCNRPVQIQVETVSGDSMASTGNIITTVDVTKGFICKNSAQLSGKCNDFRVRFLCPQEFCDQKVCWTRWFDRDDPLDSGDWELLCDLRKLYPNEICETPLYIDVVTVDTNSPITVTGQAFHM